MIRLMYGKCYKFLLTCRANWKRGDQFCGYCLLHECIFLSLQCSDYALTAEFTMGGSNKYPAVNYATVIRVCHLKTKTNLLRLIYSRRVVDEIPVDQFIFKLFSPSLYARRTRESFTESVFLTTGEANEYPLFCFSFLARVDV